MPKIFNFHKPFEMQNASLSSRLVKDIAAKTTLEPTGTEDVYGNMPTVETRGGAEMHLPEILKAIPPDKFKNYFCENREMFLSLNMTSKKFAAYMGEDYFRKDMRADVSKPLNINSLGIGLRKGFEKKIPPATVIALANGYLTGKCSRRRFVAAMELFQTKPVFHITQEDLEILGIGNIAKYGRSRELRPDHWSIVGLLNGMIDTRDFDSISRGRGIAPNAEFWTRRFPTLSPQDPFPDIMSQDWHQIGMFGFTSPTGDVVYPERLWGSTVADLAASLESYSGENHYLICVVAARLAGENTGPLQTGVTRESLRAAVYATFGASPAPCDSAALPEKQKNIRFCNLL